METASSSTQLTNRLDELYRWFVTRREVIVAFSGGVDSTLVLKAAAVALGPEHVIAVTADSASLSRSDLAAACSLAESFNVTHVLLKTSELQNDRYQANGSDRCYFCKSTLYTELAELFRDARSDQRLERFRSAPIVDGTNADDASDIRPGRKAAAEAGVLHPLAELRITKSEVRAFSKALDLPTWNKPEMACLASRLATGVQVTEEKLGIVESAEAYLQGLGFSKHRVRMHEWNSGPTEPVSRLARVEFAPEQFDRACTPEIREQIASELERIGFTYVTVDLRGYRKGGRAVPSSAGQPSEDSGAAGKTLFDIHQRGHSGIGK